MDALSLYPSGGFLAGEGDVVMLAPPFVTTQEELEEMVALLERALGAAFKGFPAGSVRPPHAPA